MATQPLRAVYSGGSLRLLDPSDLAEGEEVSLVILSDTDRVRAALGDLLAEKRPPKEPLANEAEIMRSIAEAFAGQPPLSETIIEERQSGL